LLQLFLVFILHVGLLLWRWQLQFDICLLKSMMIMMMMKPKLLPSYTARESSQSATGNSLQQLNKYLNMDDDEECLAFCHRNKSTQQAGSSTT